MGGAVGKSSPKKAKSPVPAETSPTTQSLATGKGGSRGSISPFSKGKPLSGPVSGYGESYDSDESEARPEGTSGSGKPRLMLRRILTPSRSSSPAPGMGSPMPGGGKTPLNTTSPIGKLQVGTADGRGSPMPGGNMMPSPAAATPSSPAGRRWSIAMQLKGFLGGAEEKGPPKEFPKRMLVRIPDFEGVEIETMYGKWVYEKDADGDVFRFQIPEESEPGQELLLKVVWSRIQKTPGDESSSDDDDKARFGWIAPDREKIAEELLRRDPTPERKRFLGDEESPERAELTERKEGEKEGGVSPEQGRKGKKGVKSPESRRKSLIEMTGEGKVDLAEIMSSPAARRRGSTVAGTPVVSPPSRRGSVASSSLPHKQEPEVQAPAPACRPKGFEMTGTSSDVLARKGSVAEAAPAPARRPKGFEVTGTSSDGMARKNSEAEEPQEGRDGTPVRRFSVQEDEGEEEFDGEVECWEDVKKSKAKKTTGAIAVSLRKDYKPPKKSDAFFSDEKEIKRNPLLRPFCQICRREERLCVCKKHVGMTFEGEGSAALQLANTLHAEKKPDDEGSGRFSKKVEEYKGPTLKQIVEARMKEGQAPQRDKLKEAYAKIDARYAEKRGPKPDKANPVLKLKGSGGAAMRMQRSGNSDSD